MTEMQVNANALNYALDRFRWSDKRETDRGDLLESVGIAVLALMQHHAAEKEAANEQTSR